MAYSTDIKDYYRRAWGLGDRVPFKYGGTWADWKVNYEDQMSFEEYLQDDKITKKLHALDKADGGRIGLKPGGIVEPGVMYYAKKSGMDKANLKRKTESVEEFYSRFGKEVIDKAAKEWAILSNKEKNRKRKMKVQDLDKMENTNDRSNFKRKFLDDIEKYGEWNPDRKITSRHKRILTDQDIQIKLLKETNKDTFFDPKKFAKANKITMKELKAQSALLQKSIYEKRMILAGKESRSVLNWIPDDSTIPDNTLSKLWKSKLIDQGSRVKIDELFYQAFGNPKSEKYHPKKFLAIKKNLSEYRKLREAINAKYPSIDFQLDHPLSKSTLNKIFNASAEELTRVNVLDAELNNNFKKVLSQKYQDALGYNAKGEKVGKVNLEAKKAVEKVARDLKLNIGKVSKDLTGFDYGVKEFQKLNIRDEIIKSLKNQKDLSLNFKKYIKNNPDLFKLAGFDDPSKIRTTVTKVTDKHINEISKLLSVEDQTKLSKTIQSIMRKKNSGLNVVDIARWGSAELSALDDIAGKLPSKALGAFGKLLKVAGVASIPLDVVPFVQARDLGIDKWGAVGGKNLAETYANLPAMIWEAGEWAGSKLQGKDHEWKLPYEAKFGQRATAKALRETSVEDLIANIKAQGEAAQSTDMAYGQQLLDPLVSEEEINKRIEKALELKNYYDSNPDVLPEKEEKKPTDNLTGVDKYILSNLDV